MLVPAFRFEVAMQQLNETFKANVDIRNSSWLLFEKFGDHVCTQVLLGGWWQITGIFQSISKHRRVDISKIAADVIEESHAKAEQSSISVGGGGGIFGVSVSVNAGTSWGSKSSSTDLTQSTEGHTRFLKIVVNFCYLES